MNGASVDEWRLGMEMNRLPSGSRFASDGLEATTGFEPVMGVLQTPALPLGYVARGSFRGRTGAEEGI